LDPCLAQTREERVRIGWVDGEALSAASREREIDCPAAVVLFETGNSVAGGGIEPCHRASVAAETSTTTAFVSLTPACRPHGIARASDTAIAP
jgi:hypothetical protein